VRQHGRDLLLQQRVLLRRRLPERHLRDLRRPGSGLLREQLLRLLGRRLQGRPAWPAAARVSPAAAATPAPRGCPAPGAPAPSLPAAARTWPAAPAIRARARPMRSPSAARRPWRTSASRAAARERHAASPTPTRPTGATAISPAWILAAVTSASVTPTSFPMVASHPLSFPRPPRTALSALERIGALRERSCRRRARWKAA
jgi:hypothetical protein